ncbi:MAG: BNR/Asp-box repeat protein [Paenibacillaceae bacterium]|jgi:hypothetical protein|nr:BNR/Asp-box repeat protein [Paenibacillaceae bacterium]
MEAAGTDMRNIATGWEIPCEHYCDQPYVVITKENSWLCVMTTGAGVEGEHGQHVVSTLSSDQGRTWSRLADIEPADGPESSWVMPLIVPGGRIYAFYSYNKDNIRSITGGHFDGRPGERVINRVDTLGYMAFKYSDDHGRTWSKDRHYIPIRNFAIDRRNRHRGEVQYFWGVGKPVVHDGAVYIGFAKVGDFGPGFMAESEGAFLKSTNLLTEADPALISWETLPDGDVGLRAPEGLVADEHNPVGLGDGSLYCTYRTVEGHNAHAYSRDGGHTWTAPEHAVYSPGGRKLKHPRAANFVKRFSNGRYLLWYHNHGRDYKAEPWKAYYDRNPAWVSGGIEQDGHIHWSQPEILLYDDDPAVRMSYPDFIEQDGAYFATETQKTVARVHPIDASLLEGMWSQADNREAARAGLVLEYAADQQPGKLAVSLTGSFPEFPDLREGGGFSLDLWFTLASPDEGLIAADSMNEAGVGLRLCTGGNGTLRLELGDGRTGAYWSSDAGLLQPGSRHHVTVIVDGGPKVILFLIDGVLCDGGESRQFGWGRFNRDLRSVTSGCPLTAGGGPGLVVHALRLYNRALRTSEAVGNYQAGLAAL